MGQRVVLHVGAMKSGTSYLQALLFTNQAVLAERGVLVPGRTWSDQVRSVQDVLGLGSARTGDISGYWDRLVSETTSYDGTSVVSMEFLGPAAPETAVRIVGEWDDVTVVVSARDLNRQLASMWQETVQNGRTWTFDGYLQSARDSRPRPDRRPEDVTTAGKTFWRQQNVVRLCRNWSATGARVVLLTVPPPGASRDVLRDRFLSVIGVTPDGLDDAPGSNESIGAASTVVLRRVNELLDEAGLRAPQGQHLRKEILAKKVMAARKDIEPRIGLPVAPWVESQAATMVARLQELGVELVGEWGDLTPVEVPGVDPAEIDGAEVAEAATAALARLLANQIRR
ncbi:MAG: hypothetical protein JWR85_721 [Marmoricola sp.]|nr:hypothetical protein [Marmoricola sp.]